ncbi:MAG: NADH-quinone oxidoreductase subunit NuoK [Gammaproteobacteria bacterium]
MFSSDLTLLYGFVLFALGIFGILLNHRNLIAILMCLELLLLAVNTNFIGFSRHLGDLNGQIMVFFILTVAAAEAAIALAILVLIHRKYDRADANDLRVLTG